MVINVDWFFLSHRLPLATAARDLGAEVVIAAADTGYSDTIRREGLRFLPIPISRKGANPLADLRLLWQLLKAYREIQPDLAHHVTIKPVIYGTLAARLADVKAVVNAITGLGYSFSTERDASILRPLVKALYRLALTSGRAWTVFQNPDDRDEFIRMGLVSMERTALIRGSGVDCFRFRATPLPEGPPVIMLPGRMLWDKGVEVFVEAAKKLRSSHPDAKFVLVGSVDPDNRASVPASQLEAWAAAGFVEWWGYRDDMPAVLALARIVVLPNTHREGLPKVLLEAAASARPIIASDVPGCREVVRPGVNGVLIPPGDSEALTRSLAELMSSPERCKNFGLAGRKIAETEFSVEIVVRQTLDLYRRVLGGAWPAGDGYVRDGCVR